MKYPSNLYLFHLLIALMVIGASNAQNMADYKPIYSTQKIPPVFYNLTKEQVEKDVKGADGLVTYKLDKLVDDIYSFRKEYAEAGQFYMPNDITEYVESIAKEIISVAPPTTENIEVFVTRSLEVNAFCMADGTLLINIGLIAKLDSESELAFILAHEISHYIKEHSVNDLKRSLEVAAYDNTLQGSNRNTFRKLQFSRDSEFDADGFAISLLAQTEFDPNAGVGALEKLKAADTLIDSDPKLELLKKYFDTDYCEFDTSWVSERAIERMKNSRSQLSEGAILTNDFGDLLSTHPEIEKRQYAIREIIENLDQSELKKGSKLERKSFEEIQRMALFEVVENSLRESYYVHAVANSIRLLEKYPDNIYLNTTLSKSFYWLSYYKEINSGKLTIQEPETVNDKAYFRIKGVIDNLDVTATKKLSYGNAKILSEELESNELSLFYMALNTEHYLGKNASYSYYNKYLKTYPKGQFVAYVNNRLEYMK